MTTPRKLTPKQQRFVDEYLIDLNATRAAIRAGYAKSTADKCAPIWLGKNRGSCPKKMHHVWDAVQEGMIKRSERLRIKQDNVLVHLARIAFFDPRRLFDDKGRLIPLAELDKDVSAAIKDMDIVENNDSSYTVKIRLHDKIKALDLLARHLGMFNPEKKPQQQMLTVILRIPKRNTYPDIE